MKKLLTVGILCTMGLLGCSPAEPAKTTAPASTSGGTTDVKPRNSMVGEAPREAP